MQMIVRVYLEKNCRKFIFQFSPRNKYGPYITYIKWIFYCLTSHLRQMICHFLHDISPILYISF